MPENDDMCYLIITSSALESGLTSFKGTENELNSVNCILFVNSCIHADADIVKKLNQ